MPRKRPHTTLRQTFNLSRSEAQKLLSKLTGLGARANAAQVEAMEKLTAMLANPKCDTVRFTLTHKYY